MKLGDSFSDGDRFTSKARHGVSHHRSTSHCGCGKAATLGIEMTSWLAPAKKTRVVTCFGRYRAKATCNCANTGKENFKRHHDFIFLKCRLSIHFRGGPSSPFANRRKDVREHRNRPMKISGYRNWNCFYELRNSKLSAFGNHQLFTHDPVEVACLFNSGEKGYLVTTSWEVGEFWSTCMHTNCLRPQKRLTLSKQRYWI